MIENNEQGSNPYGTYTFLRAKHHVLKDCNLQNILTPERGDGTFTATKVMATIGPASQDVDVLASLLDAGLVGIRLDLTWGPLEFHRQSLDNLQLAVHKTRKLCSTTVDTQGREIMIRRQVKMDENGWPVHEEPLIVSAGSQVILTIRDTAATPNHLPITYDKFTAMAQPGDTVYIGRYLVCGADSASLYLKVLEVTETDVVCEAQNDAELEGLLTVFHTERSNRELSNKQNDLPLFSDYDKECLIELSQNYEIDFISLSYTRDAEDVREARRFLNEIGMASTRIMAKVETRQSLLNFSGILSEADGVVISRGNLGLDCPPEKMALVQKSLIQACNVMGKPCLITRVVDTMVNTPRPTRAEATDVANAVLDGVDGILLGAETLRGKYALECVRTINKICRSAEKVFDHQYHYDYLMELAVGALTDMGMMEDSAARSRNNSHPGQSISQMLMGSPASSGTSGPTGAPAGKGLTPVGCTPTGMLLADARLPPAPEQPRTTPAPRMDEDQPVTMREAVVVMAKYGMAASSHINLPRLEKSISVGGINNLVTYEGTNMSKLESIASSAVRTADRVQAALIVVYTQHGKTPQLVCKYRPPMPILTIVIPRLVSDSLKWKLEGRASARQCLLSRGVLPMLAAPSPDGEAVLEEAIKLAHQQGLVRPNDHVVVVQRIRDDYCVKIVAVNELGLGIKPDTSRFLDSFTTNKGKLTNLNLASANRMGQGPDTPLDRTCTAPTPGRPPAW